MLHPKSLPRRGIQGRVRLTNAAFRRERTALLSESAAWKPMRYKVVYLPYLFTWKRVTPSVKKATI